MLVQYEETKDVRVLLRKLRAKSARPEALVPAPPISGLDCDDVADDEVEANEIEPAAKKDEADECQ